jgi:hypothetical protein
MMARPLIAMLVAVLPALAAAQGAIYESKDKAGPVFSDQPSPGGRPIDLPPPNVIQVPPTPPPQQAAPAAPAPAYGSLAIVSPGNQDTIRSNTGAFDVRVQVQPALRSGDVIRVKLDGTLLPQGFSSADFRITDSDWARAANLNNVEHTLQVAIANSSGAVLIESAPVSFFAQRAFRREEVHPRR